MRHFNSNNQMFINKEIGRLYFEGIIKPSSRNARLRWLRWYGHVKRREKDYVGKRMMEMAVPGRRKRGRPRRRWMDLVREDKTL